jgi:hypothetical protein
MAARKFDPNQVSALLDRGAEESRTVIPIAPAREAAGGAGGASLASVQPASAGGEASASEGADSQVEPAMLKKPITVRITEDVLHALMRHQAEVRCKPGARLGDTTIGGVIDALLRGPLGLPSLR